MRMLAGGRSLALSDDERAIAHRIERYRYDFPLFAREAQVIFNDTLQRETPLVLSDSQLLLWRVYKRLRTFPVATRILALKTRQAYYSTIGAAISAHELFFSPIKTRHTLIADKWPATKNIAEMVRLFAARAPAHWKRPYRYVNSAPYEFEYLDTGAWMDTLSGEGSEPGRGGARRFLHMSEAAYYAYADKLAQAVFPSVAEEYGTTILIESTANGFDSFMHPRWQTAVEYATSICREMGARDVFDLLFNETGWGEKAGHPNGYWPGDYLPIFIPWKMMRKYRLNPANEGLTLDKCTRLERELMEQQNLDLYQLAWRRRKIRQDCKGSKTYFDEDNAVAQFNQEFPITPEVAFQSSGSQYFPTRIVTIGSAYARNIEASKYKKEDGTVEPVLRRGKLEWVKGCAPLWTNSFTCRNRGQLRARTRRDEHGNLLVFKGPERMQGHRSSTWSYRYVIGADIAEGLAQNDYSVAMVLDRVNWEFVAIYRCHESTLTFAETLAMLAHWYDDAYVMGEYNSYGSPCCERLLQMYSRVCERPDIRSGKRQTEKGKYWAYATSSDTSKKHYLELLYEIVEEKPRVMPFPEWWHESTTFVRDERGRLGAMNKRVDPSVKNYDDCVMASSYAVLGHYYIPRPIQNMIPDTDSVIERNEWAKRTARVRNMQSAVTAVPDGIDPTRVL